MRVKLLVGRTGPYGEDGARVRLRRGTTVDVAPDVAKRLVAEQAARYVESPPEIVPPPADEDLGVGHEDDEPDESEPDTSKPRPKPKPRG